jgi:uncharacterized protein (DUF2147 family)
MRQFAGLYIVAMFLVAPVTMAANESILGKWTTAEGKSHIVISRCDAGLCGKITWLKQPNYPADDDKGMAGKSKVDRESPDPKRQNKPILGLEVLRGFKTHSSNEWRNGTIYDPDNGKTYKYKITLTDPKTLKVRGYIGFSWIGRTTV